MVSLTHTCTYLGFSKMLLKLRSPKLRLHYSVQAIGSHGLSEEVKPRQKFVEVRQKWDIPGNVVVFKTRVSLFKVKNIPWKDTDGRYSSKECSVFFGEQRRNLMFSSQPSAWPVLKRNQVAKFLKNFELYFVLYTQENDIFKK